MNNLFFLIHIQSFTVLATFLLCENFHKWHFPQSLTKSSTHLACGINACCHFLMNHSIARSIGGSFTLWCNCNFFCSAVLFGDGSTSHMDSLYQLWSGKEIQHLAGLWHSVSFSPQKTRLAFFMFFNFIFHNKYCFCIASFVFFLQCSSEERQWAMQHGRKSTDAKVNKNVKKNILQAN